MPEKSSVKRNNIGTTGAANVVIKTIGAAGANIAADLPDGTVGLHLRCASAEIYWHGNNGETLPASKGLWAASGVLSGYLPVARHTACWISASATKEIEITPIAGIAEA
jgi:hypothetical protein